VVDFFVYKQNPDDFEPQHETPENLASLEEGSEQGEYGDSSW